MTNAELKELSRSIHDHLAKVARGTKIEGKVENTADKAKVLTASTAAAGTTCTYKCASVHVNNQAEEFVEINGQLFFFFHPATIVRWPKPNLEFKDFSVRIEPRVGEAAVKRQLQDKDESTLTSLSLKCRGLNFAGDFWIDDDGTLHIIQPAWVDAQGKPILNPKGEPVGIDIVLLGNPGPEQGSNSPC